MSPLSAIPSAAIQVHDFVFDFYHPLTLPPSKTIVSRFPALPALAHIPSILPSVTAACFWLVVVCSIIVWKPPKASMYFFVFYFFRRFICWPKQFDNISLCSLPPNRLCYYTPSYQIDRLQVDCCIASSNGSHLRPRPHFSLYFLMGLALAPQTKEPTVAPPNLMAPALHGPIGSGGAMSCWRRYHTHRERGQSRCSVGWQCSFLVVVCCCVVLWVCKWNIVM